MLYLGADHARIPNLPFLGFLLAGLGISAISYADDVADWPFAIKLLAQFSAAIVAMASGIVLRKIHLPWLGEISLGLWGWPLTAAWILFATNAVNFIDGLNGLASGSVALASLCLAGIAWSQGDGFVFVSALMLAAGIAGFLPFNFPKRSHLHGRCRKPVLRLYNCGIRHTRRPLRRTDPVGPARSALLFGVFFDVAFTLVRRALAGDNLAEAHRSHLYQIAHRSGLPHRR